MHQTAARTPVGTSRHRQAAVALVVAAVLQLVGQVLLRLQGAQPPRPADDPSATWVLSHVVLVVGAVVLLVALVLVARVVGPGAGTWLGLALAVVGQSLTLAVLGIDLDVASVGVDVVRALDTWDFLAVAGAVVLVLELRRRTGPEVGANLALVALAVPALDGLVLLAAGAVVAGFAALAHGLVTARGSRSPVWLTVVTVVVYAVAAPVSWQRAALAAVVLAWTVHHLRTRNVPPVAAPA